MTVMLKSKPMVAEKRAKLTRDCAEFQATRGRQPKLVIVRDSEDPVITKYVGLKQKFGTEIGAEVEDFLAADLAAARQRILAANEDRAVDGVILQLPIRKKERTEEMCGLIAAGKDVDGLRGSGDVGSLDDSNDWGNSDGGILGERGGLVPATVKAILDLLQYYDIELAGKRIAVVGRGKLVGGPLMRVLRARDLDAEMFHRGSDLGRLREFEIIITATGVPGLIASEYVAAGTVLVDAGTASEKGVIKGDLAPELYERTDLAAITPRIGGVGPATVAGLFENLLTAATR